MNDADLYLVPNQILGPHPAEFFGAVGAVVCVCAVLEDQVTTLRHTLAAVQQGKFTHEPVGQQIKAARALSQALPQDVTVRVEQFLDAVQSAFARRNELVHSSFPAQSDGRLWGHRPSRDRSITDGTADTVETSLNELAAFIGQLGALVTSFNGVHALAVSAPHG